MTTLSFFSVLPGADCSPGVERAGRMTEVFSSNSETVLQRSVTLNLSESRSTTEDLQEIYHLNETCSFITSNNFKKVSLSSLE